MTSSNMAVLIRGITSESANSPATDFSLSGLVFHVDEKSSYVASLGSLLRNSLDDHFDLLDTKFCDGLEIKISKARLKPGAAVSTRFTTPHGTWGTCDDACVLLEFPALRKSLSNVLRKSDWKSAEFIDTMCDIIIFKCNMPLTSFARWKPAAVSLATRLHILSSPFGVFAPDVFTNSICSGIVSTIISQNGLFLTDARCLPGSAGGAVVSLDNHLLGMSLGNLQRQNEQNVDIHVCASANTLLCAAFSGHDCAVRAGIWESSLAPSSPSTPSVFSGCVSLGAAACYPVSGVAKHVDVASRAVVLLVAGAMWASGVIVDR